MQKTQEKLQILAPAGSIEQLVAAVNNGCDAVYLGLDSFNARMKAPNFTVDNLTEWVNYCHLYGVKAYVAINTSLKNDEFEQAVELLREAYLRNVDGVIVTDVALMKIAGALPKPFDVVASTQLNVHDRFGAEYVKKCGATTVVCARECSLDDIRDIASAGINVECFIHGAMCVCQSGQCLFSAMVGGNSGNRGLCAQPCRKYYFAQNASIAGGYLLSARDMCSLDTSDQLVKAGATTFKIEGRNRRPEYAGITSRVYRNLFDNRFVSSKEDFSNLAEMYNRKMSANHYLGGENSDIIYTAIPNHTGVMVGTVERGGVVATQKLHKGDGLKIFDGDKEVCGGTVLENGDKFVKVQFSGKVADGMRAHRTTSVALCEDVLSTKKRLIVSMVFEAEIGKKPRLTATCNDIEVSVCSDYVAQQAQNAPVCSADIVRQLQKSGETQYTICDIVTKIDNIFLPKSQINALRRQILNELTIALIDRYNSRFAVRKSVDLSIGKLMSGLNESLSANSDSSSNVKQCVAAICHDEQQLSQARESCDYLIYKPETVNRKSFEIAAKYGAFIDLPSFADLGLVCSLLDEVRVGLFCNNVGQVELACKYGVEYIAGGGLNIYNDFMSNEFANASTFVYSRELTLKEIAKFTVSNGLTFIDGEIPLMQLCHCPYKVAFECDCATCKSDNSLIYRDEKNNRFTIRRRQAWRCLFELINGSKLSVVSKLKSVGRYLVDYDESVVRHYVNINNDMDDGYVESAPYTKGRLFDKVN